ncbi:biotin/lipoyl-containing protein, partial [Staphylococcus saprophyticus]|uniref:biotin/lipoyl-containing protein n=1 Tax=Staphylococcus saprophyticus TaxID=29385 RepID=UPI003703FA2B
MTFYEDNNLPFQFKLPHIPQPIHEPQILNSFLKPPHTIQQHHLLAQLQNDKSLVQIPSPVSATIQQLLLHEATLALLADTILKI